MAVGPVSPDVSWPAGLLLAAGLPLALALVWRPAPRPLSAVSLSDAGWTVAAVRLLAWAASAAAAAALFAAAAWLFGVRGGLAVAVSAGAWLPAVAARAIAWSAIAGADAKQDDALMGWLYDMRLLAAAGVPINAACVAAARQIDDPAFAAVRSAIAEAVATGADPLRFAAERLAGRPAADIIASIEAAERSGAATTGLLDQVFSRAAAGLEDGRRQAIDRLASSVALQITLLSISIGALLIVAVIASLDF